MFDISTFDVPEFDKILSLGLSHGQGERGKQVCIEAAICQTLGLPHGDDPGCVSEAVRRFKICLNDSPWSSPTARAAGLRDLGLAQLGSLGAVLDDEFTERITGKTIRVLIPMLFREIFTDKKCLEAADRCEREGTKEAADAARVAADAADAAAYAAYAADAAARVAADAAAYAARVAADAADAGDKYLNLSASLALETLRELHSPGVALLKESQ
jgi:hypothetical protein